MFFNHDKASLRLNVLLEARRLVGAVVQNPVLKSVEFTVASPVRVYRFVDPKHFQTQRTGIVTRVVPTHVHCVE